MIILGIDPGTRKTGYGLVRKSGGRVCHVDNGLILPPAKADLPDRLAFIFEETRKLIARFCPEAVALEDLFVAKNARSSLKLGHARGVVMLAARMGDLPVYEYSPAEIKKAVAAYGQAAKEQMQKMVRLSLALPEVPAEDASDALAAALCHCQTIRFGDRTNG